MRRMLLSLIVVLALAGSIFAQTSGYGTTDQPSGTTAPSAAVEPAPQPGTAGAPSESSMPMDAPPAHESLPATASDVPVVLAIGLFALGAVVALRLYRLRVSD